MTPDALAALHSAAFLHERPWNAAEFRDLLDSPHVELIGRPHGFALIRSIAGESELLTLAVDPAQQRRGIGRKLIGDWLTGLPATVETAFLEVASDNLGAIALYQSSGFSRAGLRPAYYLRKDGARADAVIMRLDLTQGKPGE